MKIGFFADTHTQHNRLKVPKCDMLIFGGDFMGTGYSEYEVIDFLQWFEERDSEYKIMIAGNHDRFCEDQRGIFQELLLLHPSIVYLENSGVGIEGIKIYGVPDTHEFYGWAFNRTAEQLERRASMIPDDINILITHGPSYGVLDRTENGDHMGEPQWTDKIEELKHLKYHLFGHIHYTGHRTIKLESYTAINGCVLDERYRLVNPVTVFDYEL